MDVHITVEYYAKARVLRFIQIIEILKPPAMLRRIE